jgi:polysaccharide export outer membrane protein
MSNRLRLLLVLMVAAVSSAVFAQTDDNYVLGAEDVVSVTVIRHPEFSGDFLIPTAGLIELPVAGPIKASGMTIAELSTAVKTAMATRLKKPEVTVVLKMARPKRMSVIGAVLKPGTYEMKPGWRVTEALGASGGLPPEARVSDLKAYIIRSGSSDHQNIDLPSALAGNPEANLALAEGDVLYVEGLDLMPVYVMGSVKAPGIYRLPANSSGPLQAITLAGGVLPSAATSKVKITRVATGTEEVYDITPALNGTGTVNLPKLNTGDMIIIPESDARFAVMGYVQNGGVQAIPEGREIRLAEAVAMAKPSDRSRISRVGLIRMENGVEKRYQYDLGKYVSKGDATQNPVVQPKDVIYVPETDKVDWGILGPIGIVARLLF